MTAGRTVLVIGYGNPGRGDDGLGPAFAEAVERLRLPAVTVQSDYQLAIEDAADVARYDVVIFADAAAGGDEPFSLRRLRPDEGRLGFTSHSLSPAAVLALARTLFGAEPQAYVLGIRGYAFDAFCESLSAKARANLSAAVSALAAFVREGAIDPESAHAAARLSPPPTFYEDDECKTEST